MIGDLVNLICDHSPMLTVVCGAAGLVILGFTALIAATDGRRIL